MSPLPQDFHQESVEIFPSSHSPLAANCVFPLCYITPPPRQVDILPCNVQGQREQLSAAVSSLSNNNVGSFPSMVLYMYWCCIWNPIGLFSPRSLIISVLYASLSMWGNQIPFKMLDRMPKGHERKNTCQIMTIWKILTYMQWNKKKK